MYGSTSGRQVGYIIEPSVSLPAFNLEAAIIVDIVSADGDSGSAIVDSENLVLGFLVGRMIWNGFPARVFSAAGLVLHTLGCDIRPA